MTIIYNMWPHFQNRYFYQTNSFFYTCIYSLFMYNTSAKAQDYCISYGRGYGLCCGIYSFLCLLINLIHNCTRLFHSGKETYVLVNGITKSTTASVVTGNEIPHCSVNTTDIEDSTFSTNSVDTINRKVSSDHLHTTFSSFPPWSTVGT